ncbi:MAG: pyridoxal 5'-phosphate synthase glutaminase subunit PdxT [Smithellaceae bacterium]|nr:pyridoxal 5'-phosphate synthase glutaminase subunit PdxT [Smithellaceae bacterium]
MAREVGPRQELPRMDAIGVLDLQGGVLEHIGHLERLGIKVRTVKEATDFENLAGLIIPGGESTCISKLMRIFGLEQALQAAFRSGMKIWGTCAGAILLATEVTGEEAFLKLIDMEVMRNGFGSQLDSFTYEATIPSVASVPLPLTFIRAPKILRVGVGVKVLLEGEGYVAAAETENILVTVFHPELTGCLAFHRYFAEKCGLMASRREIPVDPAWDRTSWTRLARLS